MTTTHRSFRFAGTAIVSLACGFLGSSTAFAVVITEIDYGHFEDIAGGGLVTFTNVTESSGTDPVPLYGVPVASIDSLVFNPTSFIACGTVDWDDTNGQLDYGIVAEPGLAFSAIDISGSGDYTLAGGGTAATSVAAGLIMFVTIQEVDGVAITPLVVIASESGDADLVNDAGIAQPQNLSAGIDLLAELTNVGIDYDLGVTKAEVALNNTLLAFSEQDTTAFIATKDFIIDVTTEVPEPTTAVLSMLTLASLGLAAGRKTR